MEKKKHKPKEFITPERRVEIEDDIRILERQLKGGEDNSPDGVGFMAHAVGKVQNPADIRREIGRHRKHLDEGTPKPFKTAAMKNKAYRYAKQLEKYIRDNKPRGKNISVKYPTKGREEHDFARGVDSLVLWFQKGKRAEEWYRYLSKRLDPDNPNAGNIRGL